MDKRQGWHVGYWIIALSLLMLAQSYWQGAALIEVVPYSVFEQALADGRIAEVTVTDRSLSGRLKAPEGGKSLMVATRVEPDLAARLEKYGVPYTRVVESTLLRDLLSWIVPALVFFALWYFVIRRLADKQGMGGFMSIGKSRAKVYVETDTGVDLRRRRRRRRGQGGAEGGRRLPQGPEGVRPPRRAHPQGRAAGRPAGHRQDAAGAGGGRRGRRAVLLDLRLASSSRCSSASARRACATCSSRRGRRRRRSSSSTSSTRWAARAAPSPAWAGTTRRSRR